MLYIILCLLRQDKYYHGSCVHACKLMMPPVIRTVLATLYTIPISFVVPLRIQSYPDTSQVFYITFCRGSCRKSWEFFALKAHGNWSSCSLNVIVVKSSPQVAWYRRYWQWPSPHILYHQFVAVLHCRPVKSVG